MIKKWIKVLISIIIFVIVSILLCNNSVHATDTDLLDDLDYYKPEPIGQETEFTEKVGLLLGALNIVGAIVSVITIMIIGFKYMIGSVEDKASYKKTMLPWIIGAFLVFTVTTIPNAFYNIGISITDDTPQSNGNKPDNSQYFEQMK